MIFEEWITWIGFIIGALLIGGFLAYILNQRKTVAKLARSEAEFRAIAESALTGVLRVKLSGQIIYANQAMAHMAGFEKPKNFAQANFQSLFSDPAQFAEIEKVLRSSRELRNQEMEILTKAGEKRHLLYSAFLLEDVISATVVDITGRIRKEKELQQLSHIVSQMADTVVITDTNGIIQSVNPTFEELTGYSRAEALGATPRLLKSGLHSPEFYAELWKTILSGKVFQEEMTNRKKNGELFYEIKTITPIRDVDGNITHFVATGKDITGRKQAAIPQAAFHSEVNPSVIHGAKGQAPLEQSEARDISERRKVEEVLRESRDKLSAANAALEQASRLKDEFLTSMSHELRTPLTGILGLSEVLLLQTYGPLNEKQLRALKIIETSGRHLLELINDILDLSKIEAGKFDLQVETCSAADICQASLQLVKGLANQKKQSVSFSMDPASITLRGDARRLKRMLVNLLGNAVKFTPEGGKLGLEVIGCGEAGVVSLTVWDKGIGIRTEDMGKLFQPFVQLDSSLTRQYAGTGLGLSLVQRMAELHGGSIQVESTPGEGSRFSIRLPWTSGSQEPASGPVSTPHSTSPLVMVADDNEAVLDMVTGFLKANKFRVVGVRSGFELLERAPEEHPDIILVDIQMPNLDGMETTRRLRANSDPLLARTPIIATTALAMPGDREKCLEAGINDYMSKPILLPHLVDRIHQLLKSTGG
jgi:PAS domain S-box-containing protein